MAFLTLLLIAETQFANYLSSNFTLTYSKETPDGTISADYSVIHGFSVDPFSAPFIIVAVDKLTEIEPFTHNYKGILSIEIVTQIDDTEDPVSIHDQATAQVYDLISNQEAVFSAVNADNFHLGQYYSISYAQGIGSNSEFGRCLSTKFEYEIQCQTLPVS